jgi:hypothetical protein
LSALEVWGCRPETVECCGHGRGRGRPYPGVAQGRLVVRCESVRPAKGEILGRPLDNPVAKLRRHPSARGLDRDRAVRWRHSDDDAVAHLDVCGDHGADWARIGPSFAYPDDPAAQLGEDGDHHRRIFGALALVYRRRIGRHQSVEFAEAVGDGAAVEADNQFQGSKALQAVSPEIWVRTGRKNRPRSSGRTARLQLPSTCSARPALRMVAQAWDASRQPARRR